LKLLLTQNAPHHPVAPHAGAWIETLSLDNNGKMYRGRAPRGRVD